MIKNRLLALLVGTVLLLTSFAVVPVAYADETVATPVDSSKLDLMKTLGVFPADIAPGAPLTRNDLARIYFRILMPEQADAEYVAIENRFTDLGDEHFAANFAAQMGIMNGYGDGTFNPNGTLTYNELVKTLVCFLGYNDVAVDKGGWPYGYILCANDFGFSEYADSENIVSSDVAAALFALATEVEVMELDGLSEGTRFYKKTGQNYLEKYLNIYYREGIVSANYMDNIYKTGADTDYHYINVGNTLMHLTPDTLTLRRNIGYSVNVFVKQENFSDIPEIMYYELADTTEYVITAENMAGYDHSQRKISFFTEKGRIKSFNINGAYVVYNNSVCESYDENIINPFLDPTLDSEVSLLDNNNDGEIDVVVVRAYRSYVISKIVDGKIYNKYHQSDIFDIKDFEDGDYAFTNILGETVPAASLDEGHIISVFLDQDGDIKEIIVARDYYIGVVTSIKKQSGGYDGIVVDNKYFRFASRYKTEYNASAKFEVGDKIKMFYDYNGLVCDIETAAYDRYRFGYLIDMAPESRGLDRTVNVRLLTNTGKIEVTTLKDKIEFNDVKVKSTDVPALLGYAENGVDIKRQIIRYEADKETKEIIAIEAVDDSIDETVDGFYRYKNLPEDTFSNYRITPKAFRAQLLLSGGSVVFVVPSEANRHVLEYYDTYGTEFFVDSRNYQTNYKILAYGSDANSPIADALVVEPTSGMGAIGSVAPTKFMAITETDVVLVDDELQYSFTGYVSGVLETYICNGEENYYVADGGVAPETGDIIYFGCDRIGDIAYVEYVYDASEKRMASSITANPSSTNLFAEPRYCVASVKFLNDAAMTLEIPSYVDGEDPKIEHYPTSGLIVYEYDDSGREPIVTFSGPHALHDELNNNSPATIFLSTNRSSPQFAVVHHN